MKYAILFSLLFTTTVFAEIQRADYTEGFYSCRNPDPKLPKNTYNIKTTFSFGEGQDVPFVEMTRYYRLDGKTEEQRVRKAVIRGAATVIAYDDGTAILKVMNAEIPFKNGLIQKCLP